MPPETRRLSLSPPQQDHAGPEDANLNHPILPSAPLEKTPQPHLGELTVTGETADSLHLSWTVAQGPFDSFLVQYRDRDGQPQTVVVAADQNEVVIEGLQPRRKYKFLLYGLAGGKRLGPVSALGVTGELPCLTTGLRSLRTKRLAREDGGKGRGLSRVREGRTCAHPWG